MCPVGNKSTFDEASTSTVTSSHMVLIRSGVLHLANMHELQRATILTQLILYMNIVYGCEVFGKFNMPSIFKLGDIMIGGIFPVLNKDISSTSTFESEPPGAKCAR